MTAAPKTELINLPVSPEESELIRHSASQIEATMSKFIVNSTITRAPEFALRTSDSGAAPLIPSPLSC